MVCRMDRRTFETTVSGVLGLRPRRSAAKAQTSCPDGSSTRSTSRCTSFQADDDAVSAKDFYTGNTWTKLDPVTLEIVDEKVVGPERRGSERLREAALRADRDLLQPEPPRHRAELVGERGRDAPSARSPDSTYAACTSNVDALRSAFRSTRPRSGRPGRTAARSSRRSASGPGRRSRSGSRSRSTAFVRLRSHISGSNGDTIARASTVRGIFAPGDHEARLLPALDLDWSSRPSSTSSSNRTFVFARRRVPSARARSHHMSTWKYIATSLAVPTPIARAARTSNSFFPSVSASGFAFEHVAREDASGMS